MPEPMQWPTVTIGGKKFTIRFAYSAIYQLATWGKDVASATILELAAASAGNFDKDGEWHSIGLARPLDLADMMHKGEENQLLEAVSESLKKAYPDVETSSQPVPGITIPIADQTITLTTNS